LIAPGAGNYVMTFMSHTDAVKPGHIVTQTGGSQKTCCWPDAAGDVSLGIVGLNPGHDVDAAYTAGDTFPVYMVGSAATVWVRYRTSGGATVAGSPVMADGGTADGLAIVGADSATIFNAGIGRAIHWHDDIASESWVAVKLCGV
jgi:hypothetical protein